MKFPQGLHYKNNKDLFDWWGVGFTLPYIYIDKEFDLGTVNKVYQISAPTQITFTGCEFFHKFEITILGFGFWYAHQWGY